MAYQSKQNLKGTPIYMAPEIWETQKYGKEGDVYSFSLVVYEIVTNEIPFKDFNTIAQIYANVVMKGNRPEFDFPVPDSYRNLIEKCWAYDPTDRPTFDEIVNMLKSDSGFITDLVDENGFLDYIDFIDDYQTTFDPARKVVDLNQVADSFQLVTVDHSIFEKKEEKTENDSSKNEFEMGRNYFEGINGYKHDTVLGIEYLKKSAKSGYVDSVIYYCRALIEGIYVPRNIQKAKKYLSRCLDSKNPTICELYSQVERMEGNSSKAELYFQKSASHGNAESQFEYGKMLLKEAIKYLKMADRNGLSKSGDFMSKYFNDLDEIFKQEEEEENEAKQQVRNDDNDTNKSRTDQNNENKVVEETLNDNANHNNDESEDDFEQNKSNGNKVVENSEDDINSNDNSTGQSINCANDDINNGNDKSENDENKPNQPNENGTNPANMNSSIAKIVEEEKDANKEEEEDENEEEEEEDESGNEDEIEEENEKEEEEIIEKIRENDVSYVAELGRLLPEHPPIEGRRRAVLVCTGSFCPMHKGHLKLLDTAAKFLSNEHQIDSVLGILSPSIDGFVRYRFKDEMIGFEDRYEMLKLGCNEHNMAITDDEGLFIIPDSWEGTRKRFYDYPEVLKHFRMEISRLFNDKNLLVLYVCGADFFMKNYCFAKEGYVGIARPGYQISVSSMPEYNVYVCNDKKYTGFYSDATLAIKMARERGESIEGLTYDSVVKHLHDINWI